MPKSKRSRTVHLTQTEKGGRERKSRLMDRIRAAIDEYDRVIVFSFDNMRSTPFKAMRETMAGHSRFFLGSNKVMQIALGRDAASAYRGGLNRVAAVLTGQVGLMCTNKTVEEVEKEFEEHGELDYARAGAIATQDIVVPAGELAGGLQHTMVPHLRKLGLPCELQKGVIMVRMETTVCKEGDRLTAEAAHLAKLLGVQMAWFSLSPVAVWERESEAFEAVVPGMGDASSSAAAASSA
ncbi:hypothetical protein FNF27_03527 [Cafeteria roenbergensis]|uniref:Ribosome assembly factor mrt4 n=1 Tax=Cafeteria roenbergensis TaxID=33653 RepID=A0A5A8EB18_CAFRO|nr:hypothetical protein FNF29_02277 [Cafeteria roenbergensis]KAA0174996.1 hypothetical protein FNF27_03527 [Cafeteria roenbergensis]|eukprot:KAA0154748.1 hypothetical protein FNF29_02277 [Cafeteria roenbergensis]